MFILQHFFLFSLFLLSISLFSKSFYLFEDQISYYKDLAREEFELESCSRWKVLAFNLREASRFLGTRIDEEERDSLTFITEGFLEKVEGEALELVCKSQTLALETFFYQEKNETLPKPWPNWNYAYR